MVDFDVLRSFTADDDARDEALRSGEDDVFTSDDGLGRLSGGTPPPGHLDDFGEFRGWPWHALRVRPVGKSSTQSNPRGDADDGDDDDGDDDGDGGLLETCRRMPGRASRPYRVLAHPAPLPRHRFKIKKIN